MALSNYTIYRDRRADCFLTLLRESLRELLVGLLEARTLTRGKAGDGPAPEARIEKAALDGGEGSGLHVASGVYRSCAFSKHGRHHAFCSWKSKQTREKNDR